MPRPTNEQKEALRQARAGPLDAPLRYMRRGERLIGLGLGTGASLSPAGLVGRVTPGVKDWLPDFTNIPEAAKQFRELSRQGDWDAAITSAQDEMDAGPGYWGASEALSTAFVPTGLPALAGRGLIKAAPKLAGTLSSIAPRAVRPGVQTGIASGLRGVGQVARAPWELEEAMGRGLVGGGRWLAGKAGIGGARAPTIADQVVADEAAARFAGQPGETTIEVGGARATARGARGVEQPVVGEARYWEDNPLTQARERGDSEEITEATEWIQDNPTKKTAEVSQILVRTSDVINLPGQRGEEALTGTKLTQFTRSVDDLASSMRERGFDLDKPIAIDVEQDGRVLIYEGNARVRAAQLAGIENIPVEVRYYGGGEGVTGAWNPRRLMAPPTTTTGAPTARGARAGDEGFPQGETGFDGGASPPDNIQPTAGAPTTPPAGVKGGYLADIATMDQTASEVITPDNAVVRWLAGRSGINPSAYTTDPLAKAVVAFNRRLVSSREMTNVALSAALDKHARRGLGTLGRALPIDPETGFLRGTKHPWQDVFSNPGAYKIDPATRAYIDDFNALITEMNQKLKDRGLNPFPLRDADGKFFVPRQVKELHGVTLKRHSNPHLRRVYDEALEGYGKGVRYDVDPRATAEVYLNAGWREIIEQDLQLYMMENITSITPKQLVGKPFVEAVEQSARAWRSAQSRLAALQRERLQLQTGGQFRGAEARAQKIIRDAKRPAVIANKKAINATKKDIITLRKDHNTAYRIYKSEMKAARASEAAPANLFGRAGDHISIKMWRNRFYPEEQALSLENGVNRLSESGQVLKPIRQLINTMRTGASVGDFAMPFIQGQPLLARNPVAWARMTAKHYESFFDPTVQSKVINDNLEYFQWMARNNVPIGDPEFFAGAMTGQGISLGAPLGTGSARRVLRAFGRQTIGRFQSSYNVGLGMARLELLKALKPTWKGTDAELAQYLRNMTGGLDSTALGVGPTQRNVESMFLAFSPRLLRSTVALVGDATRPWTPQGREALRTLGSWVAGINMIYILTGVALGKTWEEIQRGMNPLEGGKYLSHEINGDWVGVGGQVRAILQATAHLISTAAPGGDPAGSLLLGGLNNPLLRAYYYRAAPGTNIGLAAMETAWGADVMPFEELETPLDLGKHIGTSMFPFAVQGRLEGEQAMTVAAGLAGGRTSITRPESAVRALTLNIGGEETNYFDLYKHPLVVQYVKNALPANLHSLADEYMDADYDDKDIMELSERGIDYRKVAEALSKSRSKGGMLYRLKAEFMKAAPTEWKVAMAEIPWTNFPGDERLRDYIRERSAAGDERPDIDYSQWYRRGDVPALESIRNLAGVR